MAQAATPKRPARTRAGSKAADTSGGNTKLHVSVESQTIQHLASTTDTPTGSKSICPICKCVLQEELYDSHYAWELQRLQSGNITPEPVEEVGGTRARRGAAVAAAQQITSRPKGKGGVASLHLDENELLLYQVRASRLKRANAHGNSKASRKRSRTATEEYPDPDNTNCFMCGVILPKDPVEMNEHIDHCLAVQIDSSQNFDIEEGLAEPPEGQWEEYEWGGERRVRVTSMLEGGYAASGFAVHKSSAQQDTDEEIDIDDDGTGEFGETQYSEEDIHVFRGSEAVEEDGMAVAAQPTESQPADWPSDIVDSSSLRSMPADTRLIIESLKSRVRDLEASSSKGASKCLICLDPYTVPLASVICWHVHCEKCWLQTLATKRLCPQCQKITSPSDLRRIYL
ncbi:hypothetical protein DFS34DRAFT_54384 [Phlyctochytrium arcticum]|nr:hypothetical protein DFS34DRAFT_54384 [Phlyctochytrium arcticum]